MALCLSPSLAEQYIKNVNRIAGESALELALGSDLSISADSLGFY